MIYTEDALLCAMPQTTVYMRSTMMMTGQIIDFVCAANDTREQKRHNDTVAD